MKERADYNPIWREINSICLVDKKEQAADQDDENSSAEEESLTAFAAGLRAEVFFLGKRTIDRLLSTPTEPSELLATLCSK